MRKTFKNLLDVLDEETACYAEMDNLLTDENASISLSGRERFDHIQSLKEGLLEKLCQHEKERKRLVWGLAGAGGQESSSLTVRQLASLLPPPEGTLLMSRAEQLRSIIGAVQKKNRRSQALMRQYRDLIENSLTLLNHHTGNNAIYQKTGAVASFSGYGSGGGRIIRRVF